MSDLIKRLRRYSYQQGTDDYLGQLIAELVSDLHEAADEIERLEAALRRCCQCGDGMYAITGEQCPACAALKEADDE